MIAAARIMSPLQIVRTSLSSIRLILKAVVILFLAWSLGGACKDVGTAAYLVALFHEVISPVGFAIVVFTLSCLVAFATGSSYSTMAILLPNVVPLAFEVGESLSQVTTGTPGNSLFFWIKDGADIISAIGQPADSTGSNTSLSGHRTEAVSAMK